MLEHRGLIGTEALARRDDSPSMSPSIPERLDGDWDKPGTLDVLPNELLD
jgi:hypothetical protein